MLRWRQGPKRVLVEGADLAWQRFLAALLDPEDYVLDFCPGPYAIPGGCPLMGGFPCPRVDWADIVLSALDPDDPLEGRILKALPESRPGMSLIVLDADPPVVCRSV